MAMVRVSANLIEELLFKGLRSRITAARYNPDCGWLELEIEGDDVPAEPEADVIATKYDNPGADPYTTVEIRGRGS